MKGSFPKAFKSRVHCAFGNVLEEGHICELFHIINIYTASGLDTNVSLI